MCASTVNQRPPTEDRQLDGISLHYTLMEPIAFSHPIKLSERLCGSNRLQASSEVEKERYELHTMTDLSRHCGLANRTQTSMWWATWASMRQSGLYVLWAPSEACNCAFGDVLSELQFDKAPFSKLSFVKTLENKIDSFWVAPQQST